MDKDKKEKTYKEVLDDFSKDKLPVESMRAGLRALKKGLNEVDESEKEQLIEAIKSINRILRKRGKILHTD